MSRSRSLLRFAAPLVIFALVGCHSGGDAQAPSSHAETTSAEGQPSPAEDARTALNAASPGLKSCLRDRGVSSVDVTTKFESTGKISSVDVKPASPAVATCVREKLGEVAILAFRGDPVTMSTHLEP